MTAAEIDQTKVPFSVVVHPYDSPTRRSCAYELVTANSANARHALVFIGGLTDGPHTTPYIRSIAKHLATADTAKDLSYSVFEFRMQSSFYGYGFKSLTDDVADLSALVKHLKEKLGRDKIVFLGHSTGCQDQMAYAKAMKAGESPEVDGFILQGPVSDREALVPYIKTGEYDILIAETKKLIDEGKGNTIVPSEFLPEMFKLPHSAYRLHSLLSFKYVSLLTPNTIQIVCNKPLTKHAVAMMTFFQRTSRTSVSPMSGASSQSQYLCCRQKRMSLCLKALMCPKMWRAGRRSVHQACSASFRARSLTPITPSSRLNRKHGWPIG